MHYCGVVSTQRALQLAMLEEVRTPEPPVRLSAIFFEPGSAEQVAAELSSLGEVVVGVGAPLAGPRDGRPGRDCDALLSRRGVAPQPQDPQARELAELMGDLAVFAPDGDARDGQVREGAPPWQGGGGGGAGGPPLGRGGGPPWGPAASRSWTRPPARCARTATPW